MSVNSDQVRALAIAERTASSLSLLGVLVIIVTFVVSPHFRNPIQRLALLNAFFNLFDVTLTMISVDGPRMGNLSALCQAQGFLNQMYVSLALCTGCRLLLEGMPNARSDESTCAGANMLIKPDVIGSP
jgi:hypothetical protein